MLHLSSPGLADVTASPVFIVIQLHFLPLLLLTFLIKDGRMHCLGDLDL
jgi:hypothetical protein